MIQIKRWIMDHDLMMGINVIRRKLVRRLKKSPRVNQSTITPPPFISIIKKGKYFPQDQHINLNQLPKNKLQRKIILTMKRTMINPLMTQLQTDPISWAKN
ncbi:unnamed protein product [Ambrosiozyma monospora]|uniref:Unnamed protein product n=1 Tax=Ambrosiozyma monospora TaxID=43982 RepID=A0ACB5T9S6_AMBMO|nr:unnamed protein product [Ambrosiozyma monospora]